MAKEFLKDRTIFRLGDLIDDKNGNIQQTIRNNVLTFRNLYMTNITLNRSKESEMDQNFEIYDIINGALTEDNKTDLKNTFHGIFIETDKLKFPRVVPPPSNAPRVLPTKQVGDVARNVIVVVVICVAVYMVNLW